MSKFLFVSATGQLGGAERSLVELATAICPAKHEVFAAIGSPGPLTTALEAAGVRTQLIAMQRLQRTVNPLRLAEYVAVIARASRSIAELAISLDVDLIHANSDMAHVYAGEAAARAEIPCIWHSRDMLKLGPIGERMIRQAACVIAISESVLRHLQELGVPEKKTRLVRNGVAIARFPEGPARDEARREARKILGLDPYCFVVGAAGAFVPWKRHEDFIRTFARLCELEVADQTRRPEGPGL